VRRYLSLLWLSAQRLHFFLDDYTITASHIVLVRRGRNHEEDGLDSHAGVLLTAFACLATTMSILPDAQNFTIRDSNFMQTLNTQSTTNITNQYGRSGEWRRFPY